MNTVWRRTSAKAYSPAASSNDSILLGSSTGVTVE